MQITLDTSVLYQALRSSKGASYAILMLIRQKKISVALTVPVFMEYEDVMLRESSLEDFGLQKPDVDAVLDMLAHLGEKHDVHYLLRPNLPDEGNNLFVECAFASNSDYLVTSNLRHFLASELRGFVFKVVTPSQFMQIWRVKSE